MRLICPSCKQSVTLPDAAAGVLTPCPNCGRSIVPPALTGAAIDAAPEPPPPSPPAPTGRESARPATSSSPPVVPASGASVSARPWLHMTLRRNVVQWIAPLALVVAFLLTFGTWIAAAPNGTRIYTQSGWQAAFTGGFDADPVGDRVMQAENDLKKNSGANVSLVLYLILLIPAAVIAVADRLLTDRWATIPDLFRTVWPRRHLVIAVLCAVLLLLLVMPLYFRVGLETAATATAEAAVTQTQSSAGKPEPTTTEKTERDIQRDIAVARFGLTRTTWLRLAVFVQFIALIGIGTTWWLDRHPSAPDPRVEVYC